MNRNGAALADPWDTNSSFLLPAAAAAEKKEWCGFDMPSSAVCANNYWSIFIALLCGKGLLISGLYQLFEFNSIIAVLFVIDNWTHICLLKFFDFEHPFTYNEIKE